MGHTILSIASTSFFADYGAHVRIWEETRALQKRGHRIVIATYHNGDNMPGFEIRRSWDVPWVKRTMVGASRHKLYLDVALSWRALRVAWEIKPDIIHAHIHESALIGSVLSKMFNVPLIFDYQGSLTSEMLDHGFLVRGGLSYPTFRALEDWIVKRADAIVTSTRHGADVLVREFGCPPDRIALVPDAVDVHRFRPLFELAGEDGHVTRAAGLRQELGIPPDRRVVGYLGLLAEYQGITHLLRAAQLLIQRGGNAHFLIMGFPGEARYLRMAEELGLGGRVTFTGAVQYEDAPRYLALVDVAVSAKLSQTEGNGKLLNYVAMGLPTVAFDTPVNREILGDLGVYAPYGDWTALAAELGGVLKDPAAAEQRGRALRAKAVAEHNWETSADQLLEVYDRVMR